MYKTIDNVLKRRADALPAPEKGRPVQLSYPASILPQPPRMELLLVCSGLEACSQILEYEYGGS